MCIGANGHGFPAGERAEEETAPLLLEASIDQLVGSLHMHDALNRPLLPQEGACLGIYMAAI